MPRLLTSPAAWYVAAIIVVACFFLDSLLSAGPVWDELEEFVKLKAQLDFATDILSGKTGMTFHSLPGDYAYYGIGSVLPPYVLSYLIDIVWLKKSVHSYENSYSLLLHVLTFLFAIAAVEFTRRLVSLVSGSREAGYLAGATLVLIPFWTGYAFFDYKDIPVATGVIAATYYAAAYLSNGRARISFCFFLSIFFIGIQKSAAIPLAVPACLAVLVAALREPSVRRFATLTLQGAICVVLLYVSTPPAWPNPISFAVESLAYMSQHGWGGCTLTAGECIGRDHANGQGYSVLKYLGLWYGTQLPILVWLGLGGSLYFYVRRFLRWRLVHHLVFAALAWPVLAIAIRNSTLYDGVRHTLFLIPLAVATLFVMIPADVLRAHRWWLLCYFGFLIVDSIELQPYQFVWFNEVGRFFASDRNFETDYWGFSLREATAQARALQGPADWIVGSPADVNPSHLVRIYAGERFSTNENAVPARAKYFFVRTTRMNMQPPRDCASVHYVTRRELLAPDALRLSFVAECGGESHEGR
jgi:hypothetical protein